MAVMLPADQRVSEPATFRRVVRQGARASSRRLVVHVEPGGGEIGTPSRLGLIVGRGVGDAVTRNLVKRRLRHQARDALGALPPASVVVVRALPAAAGATSSELAGDLTACLRRARPRVASEAAR